MAQNHNRATLAKFDEIAGVADLSCTTWVFQNYSRLATMILCGAISDGGFITSSNFLMDGGDTAAYW